MTVMERTWKDIAIDEALSWKGTPYRFGACFKGRGVDCARFILSVFKKAGKVLPGYEPPAQHKDWHMGKDVDKETFVRELLKFAIQVDIEARQIADVISFEFAHVESHLGIVLPEDNFIHAVSGREVMIHPIKAFWTRIRGIYRAK